MRPFEPRKRQRLLGYDYSLTNLYCVTFDTQYRAELFGCIRNGEMHLNDAGHMVDGTWASAAERYPAVIPDCHVVMPDHVHLLFGLSPAQPASPSISAIVQWIKTTTTRRYMRMAAVQDWQPFDGRLWHTGFHDRIVRSPEEADRIRAYIEDNPRRRWLRMLEAASSDGQVMR